MVKKIILKVSVLSTGQQTRVFYLLYQGPRIIEIMHFLTQFAIMNVGSTARVFYLLMQKPKRNL